MLLTVLVPTYRRPEYLQNCLRGIAAQTRAADEVLITIREDDEQTLAMFGNWETRLPLRKVLLDRPGVIVAMNAGCAVAKGEIISLTDDDAVPRPDWLARIETVLAADQKIGVLGGLDVLRSGGDIPTRFTTEVGVIKPYGRMLGNHHRGKGPIQKVDHLKGVNLSWRVSAAGPQPFLTDLRGQGAQVFWELSFCLRLASKGWKIMYDPTIIVDHFVAMRFDDDKRADRTVAAYEDAAFNFYLTLMRDHRPGWKRTTALLWARLIGTKGMPGYLREMCSYILGDEQGKAVAHVTRRAWRDAVQYSIRLANR